MLSYHGVDTLRNATLEDKILEATHINVCVCWLVSVKVCESTRHCSVIQFSISPFPLTLLVLFENRIEIDGDENIR